MTKARVVAAAILLLSLRLAAAVRLDLFGDEAFYWQCSRQLDWAYADHPFMTAGLVRLGTALFGDSPLGVRSLFLLLGCLIAPLTYGLARLMVDDRKALWSAALSLLLPGSALVGALATPDVPLLVFGLLQLVFLIRALRSPPDSLGAWLLVGLSTALGLATHYRFLVLLACCGLSLLLSNQGRARLRTPGPWLAAALAGLGLLPVLIFNQANDYRPLLYQFGERHASAAGVLGIGKHVLLQAIVVSPALYVVLLATLGETWRRARERPQADVLLIYSALPLGIYALASPFSDSSHDSAQWPLHAYLPLLVFAPNVLQHWKIALGWRPWIARAAPSLAALLLLGIAVELGTGWLGLRFLSRPFAGWSDIGQRAAALLDEAQSSGEQPPWIVCDHYVLAAEVDFALQSAHPVYVLDHERNADHGRALQYELWGKRLPDLVDHAGQEVLILVEITETGYGERDAWRSAIEACFEEFQLIEKVEIPLERKPRRVEFYRGLVRTGADLSRTSSEP